MTNPSVTRVKSAVQGDFWTLTSLNWVQFARSSDDLLDVGQGQFVHHAPAILFGHGLGVQFFHRRQVATAVQGDEIFFWLHHNGVAINTFVIRVDLDLACYI